MYRPLLRSKIFSADEIEEFVKGQLFLGKRSTVVGESLPFSPGSTLGTED